MNEFYQKNHIHAIGKVNEEETYRRLLSILKLKAIYSRQKLDELNIEHKGANSYGLEIPNGKEWMYYDEDIHYEVISLHDPSNDLLSGAIEKNMKFGCFDPTKIAFAISKDIVSLPIEETKGIDIGEVQVNDLIPAEFIRGIIIPSQELISFEIQQLLCDKLKQLCENMNRPLPIYDYQGKLLYQVAQRKTTNLK